MRRRSEPLASEACPACGGPLVPWREATASDARIAGGERFHLGRCASCGTARLLDPPASEQADALYEAGTYGEPRGSLSRLIEPLRRLADRDRLRVLGIGDESLRVLEIGAGDGALLALLAARGHRVRGVEPSPTACRRARASGVQMIEAELESAELERAAFDLVILWHSLEHIEDPALALRRARSALAPGGRLVVAVPNLASLQARIGGDRWMHQDVPRHRSHFTPEGLRRLLLRSDLRVERETHLLVEQNPLGMWQTLLNRVTFERDWAFRLLKRDVQGRGRRRAWDAACTALLAAPLAIVATALELVAGLARRGGSVVVTASAAGE